MLNVLLDNGCFGDFSSRRGFMMCSMCGAGRNRVGDKMRDNRISLSLLAFISRSVIKLAGDTRFFSLFK